MYSVANSIYGLPLVANEGKSPFQKYPRLAEAVEMEVAGFLSFYSGSSDEKPQAFGLDIGGFDEACAFVNMADVPSAPTPEQIEAYQALFAAQTPELQADLRALGEPFVFILWSTS